MTDAIRPMFDPDYSKYPNGFWTPGFCEYTLGDTDEHEIYCVDSFRWLRGQASKIEAMREYEDTALGYRTIVTSPRYNCGKNYGEGICDKTSREDYLEEMHEMGELLLRVSTDDCVFFLNMGDDATWPDRSFQVMKAYERAGWDHIQTIIWTKHQAGSGHFQSIRGNKRLNPVTEYVFMMAKNRESYELNRLAIGVPYSDKSNLERFGHKQDLRCNGNLWFMPYETVGKTVKKCHAAPFPIDLPRRCIKLNGCKGPVLDPFAGILTTARACEELDVPYTMLDLSYDSIKIGKALIESDRAKRGQT